MAQHRKDISLAGQFLKSYRERHGLTQEQLSYDLHMEPRTLRAYENGERQLNNVKELHRVADRLGIEPIDCLNVFFSQKCAKMIDEGSKTGKVIAFGWYGGKYSHLNWLLPLLPKTTHYCEPFGGSAAVLINREPSPVETYNDLYGDVVNFFRVLRDQKEALVEAIGLTPFSREEFELACTSTDGVANLERARRFYVLARQVRTDLAQKASGGRWAHCLLTSRAGMAGAVSRWLGSVEDLPEIAQRLLRVQIEHAPAPEVIQRYDSEETLFYCDPPYAHDSRGDTNAYAHEMKDKEHRELAEVLHSQQEIVKRIELVVRSPHNRACVRFLLACALAKSAEPGLDIRKPYTEIGTPDSFSGRVYDERYIGDFVRTQRYSF